MSNKHTEAATAARWSCRLCSAEERAPLIEKEGYSYVLCADCGVASLNPVPSETFLEGIYEDFLDLECDGVKMSDHFSPEYKSAYFKEKNLDFADIGYTPAPTVRCLDVGSADGIFLRYMDEVHSITGEGIDISRHMVEVARKEGFDCSNKKLGELTGPYGLITLWDTIEHLTEPKHALEEIHGLLADGGDLIIQTPCMGAVSEAWGAAWIQYQPPYHTHLFTEKGLVSLLEKTGYIVAGRVRFGAGVTESANALKPVFDRVVKSAGVGDTIVIWAKKR